MDVVHPTDTVHKMLGCVWLQCSTGDKVDHDVGLAVTLHCQVVKIHAIDSGWRAIGGYEAA